MKKIVVLTIVIVVLIVALCACDESTSSMSKEDSNTLVAISNNLQEISENLKDKTDQNIITTHKQIDVDLSDYSNTYDDQIKLINYLKKSLWGKTIDSVSVLTNGEGSASSYEYYNQYIYNPDGITIEYVDKYESAGIYIGKDGTNRVYYAKNLYNISFGYYEEVLN